jgi:hypothetical protein
MGCSECIPLTTPHWRLTLGACQQVAALMGVAPINCNSSKMRGKRFVIGGRAGVRSDCREVGAP